MENGPFIDGLPISLVRLQVALFQIQSGSYILSLIVAQSVIVTGKIKAIIIIIAI